MWAGGGGAGGALCVDNDSDVVGQEEVADALRVCVCVCVCMCPHFSVCMYVCMCICIYMHIYIYTSLLYIYPMKTCSLLYNVPSAGGSISQRYVSGPRVKNI